MSVRIEWGEPSFVLSGLTHEEVPAPEGYDWPKLCPLCSAGMFYQLDVVMYGQRAYCYGGHSFTWEQRKPEVLLIEREAAR